MIVFGNIMNGVKHMHDRGVCHRYCFCKDDHQVLIWERRVSLVSLFHLYRVNDFLPESARCLFEIFVYAYMYYTCGRYHRLRQEPVSGQHLHLR